MGSRGHSLDLQSYCHFPGMVGGTWGPWGETCRRVEAEIVKARLKQHGYFIHLSRSSFLVALWCIAKRATTAVESEVDVSS